MMLSGDKTVELQFTVLPGTEDGALALGLVLKSATNWCETLYRSQRLSDIIVSATKQTDGTWFVKVFAVGDGLTLYSDSTPPTTT